MTCHDDMTCHVATLTQLLDDVLFQTCLSLIKRARRIHAGRDLPFPFRFLATQQYRGVVVVVDS
jgi:hypothetical protein